MNIHNLIQGSQEWLAVRREHFTASEAAAMLGLSPYTTRNELLEQKATGVVPDVDASTQRLFDRGHESEATARLIAEKIIGAELYPCTGSESVNGLPLLASFDGLTMSEEVEFEHKLFNAKLAAFISTENDLPDTHWPQVEHQLLVSGANKCLFMTSDGTEDNCTWIWYESMPERRARLIAGWAQFAKDKAAYVPQPAEPELVKSEGESLPAVFVQVQGSLAVTNNLAKFGDALQAFLGRINKEPETDQDFADCEAAIKTLSRAEEALDAAEASALAQVACIDDMCKMKATLREVARSNRLMLEKLVKSEKENRKQALVRGGQDAWAAHMAGLNASLGKPYMPSITVDFGGCIKGMSKLSNMKDAIDTKLANAKIEADSVCIKIAANLASLRELASAHSFLFADTSSIVLKANEDLVSLIKVRISEHEAAEAKKLEEQRERIRAEEQAKAQREAQEEARKQIAQAEENARIAREAERLAAQAAAPVVEPALTPVSVAPVQAAPIAIPTASVFKQPEPSSPPSLRLGQIGDYLGFSVTQAFLESIGFPAASKERSSVLYHKADFPLMCQAIARHVLAVQLQKAAA